MDHKNQRVHLFTCKTKREESVILFFNYTEKEYRESIDLYNKYNTSKYSAIELENCFKDTYISFNEIINSDSSDEILFSIKEIMKKHVPAVYEQMKDGELVKGKYEFYCKKKKTRKQA